MRKNKMPTLLLKLIIPLERHDLDDWGRPHGPIFHRWLPEGESDSIFIRTKSRNVIVKAWFERCGFVQDGWITFDYKKRETDSNIIKRQAKLDSGPLRVSIQVKGVTKQDITTLAKVVQGDKDFIRIGKRVIKILNESVIPFIDTLRYYYGQYWLQGLNKWNSAEETLGSYFRKIYTQYSIDRGKTWQDFTPDKIETKAHVFVVLPSDFSAYISQEDWKSLDNIDPCEFKLTLSIKLLQTAHQLMEEGDFKQAIIEGNTALEVAISDLFKDRISLSKQLKKEMESFWQLKIRAQLTVIASLIQGLSRDDIENSIEMVKVRNKIVHEGFSPKNDFATRKKLKSFFSIISKIISEKNIRFPSTKDANTLFPEEKQ